MHFQFLIEDHSTEILIQCIMNMLQEMYPENMITYDMKSFMGIGHLRTKGNLLERKSGNLLNNLRLYLSGFDKSLQCMDQVAIVIVLDNDSRDITEFRTKLESIVSEYVTHVDCVIGIAVKEMEAWLLGDLNAILHAYPNAKTRFVTSYIQDSLTDTWEVLANALYPGGIQALRKKAKNSYSEIGKAKCEWAEKIGKEMNIGENKSPSFQRFINELKTRLK